MMKLFSENDTFPPFNEAISSIFLNFIIYFGLLNFFSDNYFQLNAYCPEILMNEAWYNIFNLRYFVFNITKSNSTYIYISLYSQ